jgi:hypothetical protein
MRNLGKLLRLAALITGTIMVVLPAAASADARVSTHLVCPTSAGTSTQVQVPTSPPTLGAWFLRAT